MALISEKKFIINPINNNGCSNGDNKFNYYSQTSLVNARIDFKSSKEHSTDESSDEDISTQLKSKYNVLLPDACSADKVKQFYTNSISPINKLKQSTNNAIKQEPDNRDGNELGQPKQILYPRERIALEWKRVNRIGAGLTNLGNTCFMNSVLQCLTYCPPLVNYFNSIKDEHPSKCRQSFCMICLMMKHIENALHRTNAVIKPVYICQRLKSIAKHFTFGRQEDSHEFLRYVIDHMWRSCLSIHEHELGIVGTVSKLDHLTKSTTAINHIFGGYHRSQVFCLQCKEKSNTYDYFMDFMLDIQNVSSLEEALQKFVTPEILKNENAYKCSKCKKNVAAKKHFTVHRAPNVATFQFKRFDCSRMFGKISKPVSYPEKLNLRPYMSDKGSPLMYKLISVLVHLGSSSNSGHYYCYVRNSNNSWYLMDDSQVNQVSLNEVLSQKAYVLFYNRITTDTAQNTNKSPLQSSQLIPQQKTKISHPEQLQNQSKYFNSSFKFTPNLSEKSLNSLPSNENGTTERNDLPHKTNYVSLSPLRLNMPVNKQDRCQSPAKKTALLVPYGKDSDEEKDDSNDNDKLTQLSNTAKLHQETRLVVSSNGQPSNGESRQTCSLSNNSTKSNDVTREKEPIPILKVKATTNSWQVVESTPSMKSIEDKGLCKIQSNWKISKSSDSFSIEDKKCINGINLSCNANEKPSDIKDCSSSESRDRKERKKEKKKKRKMKEKEKERLKKKRNSSESDEEPEYKWVERTKETLELEHHDKEKRKSSHLNENDIKFDTNKRIKLDITPGSPKKNDILDALLKGASRGYHDNVKSWDGGVSNLNRIISEEDKKLNSLNNDDDEYNEEFDIGKEKKIKKHDKVDLFQNNSIRNNQFQRMQYNKYANGNNDNNCRNMSGQSKFANFGNKHEQVFTSNGKYGNDHHHHHKERYFDKHKDRFTYNKSGYSNHHHRPNFNSSSHKTKNRPNSYR